MKNEIVKSNNSAFIEKLVKASTTGMTFAQHSAKVASLDRKVKESVLEIAVHLAVMDSMKADLKKAGFSGIGAYAEKKFGYSKGMTSKLVKIAQRFLTSNMLDTMSKYGVSQMQELLPLSNDDIKAMTEAGALTEDMTVKEIREKVKEMTYEGDDSDDDSDGVTPDDSNSDSDDSDDNTTLDDYTLLKNYLNMALMLAKECKPDITGQLIDIIDSL